MHAHLFHFVIFFHSTRCTVQYILIKEGEARYQYYMGVKNKDLKLGENIIRY